MKQITFIDRGYEEVIVVDGKIIRIDWMSSKQLIGLLNRYNLLNVKEISYDEANKQGI
ncbi:hypothetical protein P4571_08100 [Niallia alba]|uniref:hypothetical protein n=1 Tax=Niallia alba TaxID=2729105 RepID=UPI002E1CBF0F|nr:hypothetical protein [Niallia alba]